MLGAPRRYADFRELEFLVNAKQLQYATTHSAYFTAAVQLLFFGNYIYSRIRGAIAPINPWQATTLEWTVGAPPPHDNFGGIEPEVFRGPDDFSQPGVEQDYTMQTEP